MAALKPRKFSPKKKPTTEFGKIRTFDAATRKPLTQLELNVWLRKGFVAIDPGARTGIAYFDKEYELQGVDCVPHLDAVEQVQAFNGLLVCEMPRVYPLQAGKVDPNDLLQLAVKIGQMIQVSRAYVLVEPRDWKSGTKKEVTAQRALTKLSPRESARCANFIRGVAESYMHNGLDALAIGLWLLGRVDFGVQSPLALQPIGF